MAPSLGAVLGCILLGALYATADAAVNAIPEARLHAMVGEEGDEEHARQHAALRRFLEDPGVVLARLLVGRVLCTVGAAVLGAWAIDAWFPKYGPLIAFAVVAVAYTAIVEVVTSVARARANDLAEPLLRIVRPFELAMIPIAAPLAFLGSKVTGAFARTSRPSDPAETARIAEKEVEYLIEEGQRTGALGHAELLQAAVDFKGTLVREVMVPRTKMVALDLKTPLARALEIITVEGHSRYPVYDGRVDDIVALLYVKDLFKVVRERQLSATTLEAIVRKPVLFVQEQQEVSTILREMRQKRLHMAVVVDEYGGTTGLVTLEDILELLVGDIRDELDDEEQVQDLGGGRLLVDAALSVDELSTRLGVELPEADGFVSVGGLVMEQLGEVPKAGTIVKVGNVDLVVRDADERRVRRIEVVSHPQRAAE